MTATVVVHVKIKNPAELSAYSEAAGPTIAAHGGAFTRRGKISEVLTGNADYDRYVEIEFPDADAARTWYASNEYQALIAGRDRGGDFMFTLVEGL